MSAGPGKIVIGRGIGAGDGTRESWRVEEISLGGAPAMSSRLSVACRIVAAVCARRHNGVAFAVA